jgi:hypothetical protein
MSSCPKEYKLPTNNWLRPIKLLIDEYNLENPKNLIYDADLIESEIKSERVIVKVSKVKSVLEANQYVYNKIKDSPHIAKIYCFLHCNEMKTYFDDNYKEVLGFCNAVHRDNNKQLISLEIMKKYNSSLRKYENKLNLETMCHFLKYLLLIQLELFTNHGFTHNDIHLGNILLLNIRKESKKKTFDFIFNNRKISYTTNILLVLTDFEEALIISSNNRKALLQSNKCTHMNTLESNIDSTFEYAIELLEDNNIKYDLARKLRRYKDNNVDSFNLFTAFCNKKIKETEYKTRVIELVEKNIIRLFSKLFDMDFISIK